MEKILVLGADGQLGGDKLRPSLEHFHSRGIEAWAADIVPEADFEPRFTQFRSYLDLTRRADRNKLFEVGRRSRFGLTIDATWPDAHLLNIVNWDGISNNILVTKPFTSIRQYAGLEALMELPAYRSLRGRVRLFDHYPFKPAMRRVLQNLAAAHAQYGNYSQIVIMITESRTVNDPEQRRRHRALVEGMVPDLGSHALMLVQLLTPVDLSWSDGGSGRIRRVRREIVPTACVRARMLHAAVDGDIDTACFLEYRVEEQFVFETPAGDRVGDPFANRFHVLVVCGKGLGPNQDDADHDVKAVEIAYQGQGRSTGVIDLETNELNQVFLAVPGIDEVPADERSHRGINEPMLRIDETWAGFSDGRSSIDDFQGTSLIWENMRLLAQTLDRDRPGLLGTYAATDRLHLVVNSFVSAANGFEYFGVDEGSGWPRNDAPMHLLRGRRVGPAIP